MNVSEPLGKNKIKLYLNKKQIFNLLRKQILKQL